MRPSQAVDLLHSAGELCQSWKGHGGLRGHGCWVLAVEFAGFSSGRFEVGASGSVAFELLRELTYVFEEVSQKDGRWSEAATVVDVDPGLVGTLGPGEVFYRPSHGMTTGRLGACRGR